MSLPPNLRMKRAISQRAGKAQGARVVAVSVSGAPPGQSRVLPDADVASAPKKDPLAGVALGSALGTRKAAPPNVVRFARAPQANLGAIALGSMSRKAPSICIGYLRHDAPEDAAHLQRFADAGCHEARREGRNGRNTLRAIINSLTKGDTVMVATLSDLAAPADLPRVVTEIEKAGAHIVALDGGADTRTAQGRGKLANQILTAKALFGLRL